MNGLRDIVFVCAGVLLIAVSLLGCDSNRTPPGEDQIVDPMIDCLPNLDGQIDADELPVALDLAVEYDISPDGTSVDLVGRVDEVGRRVWDFGASLASDQRVALAAESIAGKWYEQAMLGATFVVPAFDASGLDGAYIRDERGLLLVGLASPDENPPGGRTLLVYDAPVLLVRFPIVDGEAYSSSADITGGTLDGLPYNGTDTYDVAVDGTGRVQLPGLSFTQALRVRTDVEIVPAVGGVMTTRKQVSFFFECFGEVVRALSRADEPNTDFTSAAEVRRFAL